MIRLRILSSPLEGAESFVAISGFAKEEVPLRGAPGRMDGLLSGEATRLIQQGRLSGTWKSQALIASRGRVEPDYVLFAGLGSRQGLTLAVLSRRVEDIVARMLKASVRSMALGVLTQEGARAGFGAMASETMTGALRALSGHPCDVDLAMCEPHPERFKELVAVAERTLFRNMQGRDLSLEISL